VIIQYVDDKSYVVWPKSQAQREAVLPLPKGHNLQQPVDRA
jgi:branched-chain amino acid transport system substrate-binding protein